MESEPTEHPLDCVFCDEIEREDRLIVAENDRALVFWDLNPVCTCHALIIPKRHCVSLFELRPAEISDMMALLVVAQQIIVCSVLRTPEGYTIGINDGPVAGQTVPHVHIHLIPRYEDDVPNPRGGIRQIFSGDAYVGPL